MQKNISDYEQTCNESVRWNIPVGFFISWYANINITLISDYSDIYWPAY